MKALSIKQPWAHAILNFGKDIENRDWFTRFRGTVAVHASKTLSVAELQNFLFCVKETKLISEKQNLDLIYAFKNKTLASGAIIGTVEIVDCVEWSDSEWFFGDYGFVLANPKTLVTPVPCKGALGLWEVPKEIEKQFRFV